MNIKRYLLATCAVFVFFFLYEGFVHGYLLMGIYKQTSTVWRDFNEMSSNIPLSMGYQLALAVWVTFVFTQIYQEGGVAKGLLFGLAFGVFAGILTASWYLWLPVPAQLAWSWLATGIGEGLGGGLIMGAIYRR